MMNSRLEHLGSRIRAFLRKRRRSLLILGLLAMGYAFCLPRTLFDATLSHVVVDRKGKLLGARIAADGQWRFPVRDTVPEKFARCIIAFEDKRFYYHPGVDPIALGRALRLNLTHGEVVSGGSTLSMQVIRLSRNNPARTYLEKLWEMILATRLELRYSKEDILALYASYAPFGGNVVGLDAAAWKYFGRSADQLTWAESATLAVLPNAPSLIHPGRNRDALRNKRDRLLNRLAEAGVLDPESAELATLEPLPERPLPLPDLAPHLTARIRQASAATDAVVTTTLDANRQQQVNAIVQRHYERLAGNGIYNAAVLVLELPSGAVCAYVGNTTGESIDHGQAVDIITAPRSTGSILKPFLFASMLNEGLLLPRSLVADVPSQYGGYAPQNYNPTYDGMVPADEALARSLNVPAVRMLEDYGVPRFRDQLKKLGLTTLHRPASQYGLTLVLGGAEASLWDLAGAYAGMARSLDLHHEHLGRADERSFRPPHFLLPGASSEPPRWTATPALSAPAIWHTFNAMVELRRPEAEVGWREFASTRKLAWKTGTSFGFRDAWAIGVTPDYLVAVWVGNADGEGRPGIIGVQAAAPVMFDVFNILPPNRRWFAPPYDKMRYLPVCHHSGLRPGRFCPRLDTLWVPEAGLRVPACPYHRPVRVDSSRRWRVNSSCYPPHASREDTFFILPPLETRYYRKQVPNFRPLPPWHPGCDQATEKGAVSLVYPRPGTEIFVPVELDGSLGKVVFEAAHQDAAASLYWHMDDLYLGQTQSPHTLAVRPEPGTHTVYVIDAAGEKQQCTFRVLPRD